GRSLGLHCILTIQSIADLAQKIDRNPNLFIRQILANCNVFWIHRMNAAEDAELLAKTLGTDASMLYTAQIDSFGATGTGSVRPERTFKAHPDDIKHLPTGHGYVLNKNDLKMGVQPVLGRKGRLSN
ncbi:MAG: TraM recognition domain-containing protein, partial [Pseudomonadota bacterium]